MKSATRTRAGSGLSLLVLVLTVTGCGVFGSEERRQARIDGAVADPPCSGEGAAEFTDFGDAFPGADPSRLNEPPLPLVLTRSGTVHVTPLDFGEHSGLLSGLLPIPTDGTLTLVPVEPGQDSADLVGGDDAPPGSIDIEVRAGDWSEAEVPEGRYSIFPRYELRNVRMLGCPGGAELHLESRP